MDQLLKSKAAVDAQDNVSMSVASMSVAKGGRGVGVGAVAVMLE